MKLNEKTVANFAVCSSPIDKEGYLLKRGELNKGFQRRWFVLKGNLMFYFEKKQDKEPLGVVVLENCSVQASSVEKHSFEIIFEGVGSRTYILQADSEDEMMAWMKSIAHASYEYIRTIVTELQRQLDSLTVDNQPDVASQENPILVSLNSSSSESQQRLSRSESVEESMVPPALPKKKRSSQGLTQSCNDYLHPPTWNKMSEADKSHSLTDDSAFLSGTAAPKRTADYVPPFPIPEDLEIAQSPSGEHRLGSPLPSLDPTPVMSTTTDDVSQLTSSDAHGLSPNELAMSTSWEQPQQQPQHPSPRVRTKVLRPSDSPNSFYHMHHELGAALKVLNPEAADRLPPLPPKPQS